MKKELILGDCLDILPSLKNQSINMVLTDLPYGIFGNNVGWDKVFCLEALWKHYQRLITDNGVMVFTATQPFTTDLINSNRELFKYCLVWQKTRIGKFLNAKTRFLSEHEDIVIFSKGGCASNTAVENRMTYNPQGTIEVNTKQVIRNCQENPVRLRLG